MMDLDDPTALSARSWQARKAALLREHPADDPRVVACDDGMAYWRLKAQLDRHIPSGLVSPKLRDEVLSLTLAEIRSRRAPQTCDPEQSMSTPDSMVAQPDRAAEVRA